MKTKICAILSKDKDFAVRFMSYCNDKRLLPFKMFAYTEQEKLFESDLDNEIELVLADEFFVENLIKSNICKNVVKLTETNTNADASICKYQSADRIAKDLLGYFNLPETEVNPEKSYKLTGIYSPATKTYRTAFSLGLAEHYGKNERTLWMNLEEFAGLINVLGPNEQGGLSEALYRFRLRKEKKELNLISCIYKMGNFDVLYPAANPEDVLCFTVQEFYEFTELIAKQGKYERFIIDFGSLVSEPWTYLGICDETYLTKPSDLQGIKKLEEFEKFINNMERPMSNHKFITIPTLENFVGKAINQEMIFSPEMEVTIRRIINE